MGNVLCPSERKMNNFRDFLAYNRQREAELLNPDDDERYKGGMFAEMRRRAVEGMQELADLGCL